jgi:hypothetical protein
MSSSLSGSVTMRLGNVTYLSASASGQQMLVGKSSARMDIDYSTDTVQIKADSSVQATFDTDGFALATGQSVNEISDDGTLTS